MNLISGNQFDPLGDNVNPNRLKQKSPKTPNQETVSLLSI